MRDALARALGRRAVDGGPAAVPVYYALWSLGIRMGIAPWTFEGYPADDPPAEWVERCLEFARMESSAVKRSG